MRTFLAINLDENLKEELAGIQRELQKDLQEVKWVKPELLHITLKFLGEINVENIPLLESPLKKLAEQTFSFKVSFGRLGAFPDLRRPRVIWIGIARGASELSKLSRKINKELKSIKSLPLDRYNNAREEFKPHLTLGRNKGNTALKFNGKLPGDFHWQCHNILEVDAFYLMQSKLHPGGPTYTPLQKFLLKK